MKPKTLTVILPNGQKATRKTAHGYLYAVAARRTDADAWGVLSWHHSFENAQTQTESNWRRVYPQMRILPVVENMGAVFCTV